MDNEEDTRVVLRKGSMQVSDSKCEREDGNSNRPLVLDNTFETAFGVTVRMFRWMNARELLKAKLVCKSWQKTIELVLSRRCKVSTFFQETSLTESDRSCSDAYPGNRLKELSVVPSLVFMLHCTKVRDYPLSWYTSVKRPISDSVPPNCRLIGGIADDGLYGWNEEVDVQQPMFTPGHTNDAVAGFIFSDGLLSRCDVHVQSIAVTNAVERAMFAMSDAERNIDSFCKLFNWPREEEIKCVILLASEPSWRQHERQMCDWLLNLQMDGPQVALCGGVLSFVRAEQVIKKDDIIRITRRRFWTEDRYPMAHMVGLVFGGRGVRASSFVISSSTQKEEDIKSELNRWKRSVIDTWPCTSNCIAFLFSCCGRQSEVNEARLFTSVFPNIPICGLKTYGEYGSNVPSELLKVACENRSRKRVHSGSEEVLLSFSNVYAIVSFD
ncbi:hypothetical protein Tcan_03215 [Toxocara canis]|uniref:Uncharacterized protein n=1 Tax=Toxocara canis TaxID=6265 RepID=A0A0B2W0M0_TOXCA|nr:hypothetical protein Tcan_03215 [Toxocara canis]